jgi:hypothetical protein
METAAVMRALAAAGAGFLLAVLWFDFMFDTQVRGHHAAELPPEVRNSIAAYYRRVTTTARPMNRLVAAAMVATLVGLVGELVRDEVRTWVAVTSLVLAGGAIGLAGARTVRNAVRLGAQTDDATVQSGLARAISRDHLVCIVAILIVVILQIVAA